MIECDIVNKNVSKTVCARDALDRHEWRYCRCRMLMGPGKSEKLAFSRKRSTLNSEIGGCQDEISGEIRWTEKGFFPKVLKSGVQ